MLLDDGSNNRVRPELLPLLEALCGQRNPRSATIWLRNPNVSRILQGIASGELALSHQMLDIDPAPRPAKHIRGLLIGCGALPHRDHHLHAFQLWLTHTLPGYSSEAARLLQTFATWHHLRRMRQQFEDGQLNPGSIRTARQQISVGGRLLTHLEDLDVPFENVRQSHLDAWLAEGPSTRYQAQNFVIWAIKTKHLPPLIFPNRKARHTPVMTQQERLSLLSRFLQPAQDEPLPVAFRLAAVLLLLYAQPMTRIVRLRMDAIIDTPDGPAIRLGVDPAVLPPAVADLVAQHREDRRNTNTAGNKDSPWLFPGSAPGQPLHPSYFMGCVRDIGVHLLGGRNSALRQLVLDMPPAVAAQAVGYSPQVAERHARDSGATWVSYAAYRSQQPRT